MEASKSRNQELNQLDREREALRRKKSGLLPWLIALLLSAALICFYFSLAEPTVMGVMAVAILLTYGIYNFHIQSPFDDLKHRARELLVAEFMSTNHPNIDYNFYPTKRDVERLVTESKLVSANDYEEEDVIKGTYDGVKFYLSEIRLSNSSDDSSSVVFEGMLFRITTPDKTYPTVQIQSKMGLLKQLFTKFKLNEKYQFWYDTQAPEEFKKKMYPLFPFIRHLKDRQGDIRIKVKGRSITILMASEMHFLDEPKPKVGTSFQKSVYFENIGKQLNSLLFIVEAFAKNMEANEVEERLELREIEYREENNNDELV